jgi:tRNA threonylcarbamoyladenosine biosynthesis protein TsaB
MKLLAFDTSTDVMSIAVTRPQDGQTLIWQHTGAGGAQASAELIPAMNRLMAQAELRYDDLDAIVFGQGPGSFTGLRTACAVAQGLAFGTTAHKKRQQAVPVLPIDTLLAVAEEARWHHAPKATALSVCALLDARMDQLYCAIYQFAGGVWLATRACELIAPEDAALLSVCQQAQAWAGNVFEAYGPRLRAPPEVALWRALPTATAMLRLAPARLAAGEGVAAHEALPVYIRDKVAKTTLERAAEKASHPSP